MLRLMFEWKLPYSSPSHPKTCVGRVKSMLVSAVVVKNGFSTARLGLLRTPLTHSLWTTPKDLSITNHAQNLLHFCQNQVTKFSLENQIFSQ